jgi:hypothetical protein
VEEEVISIVSMIPEKSAKKNSFDGFDGGQVYENR